MQYKVGTVSVTNGSNVVTGASTAFIGNASVGDSFKVYAENAIYQVIAVDSDTQIKISPNYAGTTQGTARYQIGRDRTPNLGLAEINPGDEDWPYWLTNEVVRKLDVAVANGGGGSGTGGTAALFSQLGDVVVGPNAPADTTKIWVKSPQAIGGSGGSLLLAQLSDVYIGTAEPTDPAKVFWIKSPT